MSSSLSVRSATVPSPLDCVVRNEDWQSLIGLLEVPISESTNNTYSIGNTEPPPSERGNLWYRLNADGTPDGWYRYAMGFWLKKHEAAPGTIIMWEGAESDIPTFDGGEAGPVTLTSGPFWERVTQMDAKFPIGPGVLPSTTAISIGDTGGEEKHVLDDAEIPKHDHGLSPDSLGTKNLVATEPTPGTFYSLVSTTARVTSVVGSEFGGDVNGDTTGHNNLPPFKAIWFLRKTARQFFRI